MPPTRSRPYQPDARASLTSATRPAAAPNGGSARGYLGSFRAAGRPQQSRYGLLDGRLFCIFIHRHLWGEYPHLPRAVCVGLLLPVGQAAPLRSFGAVVMPWCRARRAGARAAACPGGCSSLWCRSGRRRGWPGEGRWALAGRTEGPGRGCRTSLAWLLPVRRCCPRGVRGDECQLLRRAGTGP